MTTTFAKQIFRLATLSIALFTASSANAQTLKRVTTFATGAAVNATGPDSIALGRHSVWISYTNGADSTGAGGSSTVVEYKLDGTIKHTYTIAGSVDGLKIEPGTGLVWALQNQDGNSTLTFIDPQLHILIGPIPYAVTSGVQGYDDVAFRFDKVFLSYTNPVGPTSPTIQLLQPGSNPLAVTPILLMNATGTNLASGQIGPTTQNDPDSLKVAPNGDLILTSGDDGQLIFVHHPGELNQSVSFLSLLDPSGAHVSGLDDAVFVTAERGTFYITDTGNNRVLKIEAEDLKKGSLFANVGSINAFGLVDMKTGRVTNELPGLSAPHGMEFVPNADDDDDHDHESCKQE